MSARSHFEEAHFGNLPGAEIVRQGLEDLAAGRESASALLLEISSTRLARAGLQLPLFSAQTLPAEIRLYRLLAREHGREAYSQYNALLRRVVSLARALESQPAPRQPPTSFP